MGSPESERQRQADENPHTATFRSGASTIMAPTITPPPADPAGVASGSLRVNRGGGYNDFANHLPGAYIGFGLEFEYAGGRGLSDAITQWLARNGIPEG